jgi:hypothetical protein
VGIRSRSCRVAVDIWYGSEDDNTTIDHTEWLLASIPGARGREYSGGHDPADATQRLILQALRS